jgi:hypothetical protein
MPLHPPSGPEALAAVIEQAEEAELAEADKAWLAKLAARDPIPGQERDGVAAGAWDGDDLGLPPDCPVIPLGVDGDVYWFLDTLGQLRALEFSQFGQKAITSLFMGRHHYLYWAWPRLNKDGAIVSWRQEKAAEDLMGACARKGPWNAVEQARGRGAWELGTGKLALHCGTRLYMDGQSIGLGELEGNVYMTRPPILHPYAKTIPDKGPASYLVPILKSWNWARPDIDYLLYLGWLGAALIGGALPWRPTIYMTGDKATGKSTLQRLMKLLFGNALIKSADTTAAGIYQLLKSDALPVAVDELEGKSDTRRAKAIIELARVAASGDLMLRGGEAHKGTQFNARSCFAFSSINTPPLEPADFSRMALLRLYRLPEGSVSLDLDERKLHQVGRQIMRRMMDGWHLFHERFGDYKKVLARAGHDSRGQDTFGTLLACADILTGAQEALAMELPFLSVDPDGLFWTRHFAVKNMVEYEDAEENWRLCLNRIISTHIEAWKAGTQHTMGEVLERIYSASSVDKKDFEDAKALAWRAGLTLSRPDKDMAHFGLFIPNQNPELQKLFMGSKWQGELGAGVWSGALRQAPPGSYQLRQGRVSGVKAKGTLFALHVVLNREAKTMQPKPEQQEMEQL